MAAAENGIKQVTITETLTIQLHGVAAKISDRQDQWINHSRIAPPLPFFRLTFTGLNRAEIRSKYQTYLLEAEVENG